MYCRCVMKLISTYLCRHFSGMSKLPSNSLMTCHRVMPLINYYSCSSFSGSHGWALAHVDSCSALLLVVPLGLHMEELRISSWGDGGGSAAAPRPGMLNFKTPKILCVWCLSRTAFYSLLPLELWSNYASTQLSVRQNSCWLSWEFV